MLFLLACAVSPVTASETPGAPVSATLDAPAPDFTLTDTSGKAHSLSDYRGKTVVIEWFNPDCPFVKYAHGAGGPLTTAPGNWLDKGVVWLAVNSSAPGKQGHGQARNAAAVTEYGLRYPVLLDEDGKVGRAYGAKSTPHMFVVDAKGGLVFAGGLDNAPMGTVEGTRLNYVDQALGEVLSGKPVSQKNPKNYGCSVKYAG